MTIGIAFLSGMDAMAKWLVTHDVTVIQILAIRSIIIVPLMLLYFVSRGQQTELIPNRPKLHAIRGAIGFISPLAFFLGIKQIPLTDAVVLFFSSIFVITLLSMVILKEKVGKHRWASIIFGFIGVLVVAGPQGGGQLSGYLLVLLGSTTYAILFISSRYLAATESVASLVFSFNFCVGVMSLFLLPFFWNPLNAADIVQLTGLALLAVTGHYFLTMAFASSEASLVAPFEYTAIIWAIGFDLIVWKTMPSMTTAVGATIIICSGLYIVHRERVKGSY